MNINQKAIELLEKNKYEDALALFQKAVDESRNVQSLTNLAWIYCNEEYEDTKAMVLLEEVINMNPSSYFPYNLIGEIYSRLEKWENAKDLFVTSISIHPTKTAYNNLAVANYHLGNIEDASKYFLLASENSDYSMYSHVKCLIELGKLNEAKIKIATFSKDNDEFVGEVELADLYVELGIYKEATEWFEKGWNIYLKQPNWISRYVYSLLKLNNSTYAHDLLNEVIKQKIEEVKEATEEDCDEDWSESDKHTYIKKLIDEKEVYERMFERISSGYIPNMEFDPSIQTACYLFGCTRHNHAEYQE
ncbi:tetratricopeptide repeat protein [Lysinibacillus sp. NPDC093688]|uniref:tetratricopeptide repeat protein n=1 Tax=Lysinibacillus sp. NPDC093688 TaxID=3390577 RepID=UPI003D03479B